MNPKIKKLINLQFFVLTLGTLFAWTNFSIELYSWINNMNCPTGCSMNLTNPFLTPCFGGAIFFSIALIFSLLIRKNIKK